MALHRLLIAGAIAAAVSPLIGLAQSQTPNACATACRVEYERSIAACTGANSAACLDAAAASYKTCLSTCPAR